MDERRAARYRYARRFRGELAMRTRSWTLLLAIRPVPLTHVAAHHSPAMLYDLSREISVIGTVTEFQLGKPHMRIYFDVDKPLGGHLRASATASTGRRDRRAQRMVWGEHPVVSPEMHPRRRQECREPREEVERIEHHVGGAVAIRVSCTCTSPR